MHKLLIVDDEKMIRLGIKHAINWSELGIEKVYTAASAREAMDIINKENPNIMLTDISMTEMTGLDLIKYARNIYSEKEMRIIVLTGYDSFDYARQCLKMKVQNFLLKPIDEEELKINIRTEINVLEDIRINKEKESKKIRTEGAKKQLALEKFLRDLVHQRVVYKEGEEYSEELGKERESSMTIALLISDDYMNGEVEKDFRKMTIKNICMDLIDRRGSGVTFSDEDGKIIVALYTSNEEKDISELVRNLSDILEDEYDIKPRIILGSEARSLDTLYVSYNDAIYLLEQERKGFKDIIRTKKDENKEEMIQDIYIEFKREMTSNISDVSKVLQIFDKFRELISSYNISKMQVQRWCFEITSNIYFIYIIDTCADEVIDCKIESLIQALISADKEESLEVTAMFIDKLLSRKNENKHNIIIKAKRYIDEHLQTELSVADLADMFYVSPNYFSRLFKKVMKEGCNEYIVKKRIEKSKFLLETTTIRTGKIAEIVGYNDTNYFSLAFKKHLGMSPTKYRELIQKNR